MPALPPVPLLMKPLHSVAFIQPVCVCVCTHYIYQVEYMVVVYGGQGHLTEEVPRNLLSAKKSVKISYHHASELVTHKK